MAIGKKQTSENHQSILAIAQGSGDSWARLIGRVDHLFIDRNCASAAITGVG